MSIINNSKNSWYSFNKFAIEALANNEHEDLIKAYLNFDDNKDLQNEISWQISRNRIKSFDIKSYLKYLIIEEDLQLWSCGFNWENCYFEYSIFDPYNCEREECINYLDGWSQYEWARSGQEDKQVFNNSDCFIHVFVANIDNGIAVQINLKTYEITYYAIGEDDGHWFITSGFWNINESNINYWKMLIMSEISELHLDNFDHQKVIEQIWNDNIIEKYNKKYHW